MLWWIILHCGDTLSCAMRSLEMHGKMRQLFEQAIRRDPQNRRPQAGLAVLLLQNRQGLPRAVTT
jgi:cytochrome c-type biogenesis protein CcmH/NrfG